MLPAPELVPVPSLPGSLFGGSRRVGLGSVDPSGVMRLDAIADFAQDIATEHDEFVADAEHGQWVLRSLAISVTGRRPRYGDRLELVTFCGGLGSRWAERRTSMSAAAAGNDGADRRARESRIECAAIWVRIDDRGRPCPLSPAFIARNAAVAGGRTVSARRRHGDVEPDARRRVWPLRRVDLDTMGHVNNAAHWCAVEEVLDGRPYEWAEIEFRDGLTAGSSDPELFWADDADGLRTWLCTDGAVRSSAVVQLRRAR